MQEKYKLAAQHIEGARQKEDAERQGEIPKIENDLMDSFL
jgi:hypothetical protein